MDTLELANTSAIFSDMIDAITKSIDDITYTARGMSFGIVSGLLTSLAMDHAGICVTLGAAFGAAIGLVVSRKPGRAPQKALSKA